MIEGPDDIYSGLAVGAPQSHPNQKHYVVRRCLALHPHCCACGQTKALLHNSSSTCTFTATSTSIRTKSLTVQVTRRPGWMAAS